MSSRVRLVEIMTLTATEFGQVELISEAYGREKQITKMGEEGGELAVAVLKHLIRDDGLTWDTIIEEMVDVFLMLCSVIGYFSGDDEARFREFVEDKLDREIGRIAEGTA